LARVLVDARSVLRKRSVEADVCVIGAGAAGITLARGLADRSRRVVLLESGGFEPDSATQALYRGRVFGRSYFRLDESRSRQFGGSTNCWQGLCRPLAPIDFEERSWVPHSGWPFGAEELHPYYDRAQQALGIGPFEYDGAEWATAELPVLPFAGDDIQTRVFQVNPARFLELHREELVRAGGVDLYLFANVVDIETDPDARRVERVQVACLDGNRFSVTARHFVLATGGIENARVLLASRGARPAGLGNDHDLVGRFFMEHPHVVAGAFLPSSAALPLGFYRAHVRRGVNVAGYLAPSEGLQRRESLLGFGSFLAQEAPLPEFEVALGRIVNEMDAPKQPAPDRAAFFMNELEQAPNPNSRVRLIEQKDALGMPRVQLEWRLSALDKLSIHRAHEVLGRELGRAGLGRLQMMFSDEGHDWPPGLMGGRHHMGTTRMHVDPRRGVVDADCRVHGVANLYVAGSSVFPTVGAANPTLTLVALALRLADRLKEAPA